MSFKVKNTGSVNATMLAFWFTVKNLFRKPVTIQYPAVRRPIPERWRCGTFALTTDKETGEENCIGCKLCERICPSNVIKVDMEKHDGRGWAKNFYLNLQACLQCELCVQVCPTDAIVMLLAMQSPATNRDELILNKDRLIANEKIYPTAWATGLKLQKMHEPKKA